MMLNRVRYRLRQVWSAQRGNLSEDSLRDIRGILSPEQWRLFQQLQRGEQLHAWLVWEDMRRSGLSIPPHLSIAALLHDIGKTRIRLTVWERGLVVVAKHLFPSLARKLGRQHLSDLPWWMGWSRCFLVAEQHPQWGAVLAQKAGVSELGIWFIAHHQTMPTPGEGTQRDWLTQLQRADDRH